MNNHTLGYLPALGWNSWNTFTWDINETLIKEIADCFVEKGYIDAGYEYIVIDDCWSLRERDKDGNLVAESEKISKWHESCRRLYPRKRIKIWYVFLRRNTHLCRLSGKF